MFLKNYQKIIYSIVFIYLCVSIIMVVEYFTAIHSSILGGLWIFGWFSAVIYFKGLSYLEKRGRYGNS